MLPKHPLQKMPTRPHQPLGFLDFLVLLGFLSFLGFLGLLGSLASLVSSASLASFNSLASLASSDLICQAKEAKQELWGAPEVSRTRSQLAKMAVGGVRASNKRKLICSGMLDVKQLVKAMVTGSEPARMPHTKVPSHDRVQIEVWRQPCRPALRTL